MRGERLLSATLVRIVPLPSQTVRRYRFGVFEVDALTGELRRRGVRVRLKAQPFQLLLLLLEKRGELVTREEICATLWPDGTFVDFEHGVNSAVNRVREALGDSAANPRFVETLARRGYRFVAPIEALGLDTAVHTVSSGMDAGTDEASVAVGPAADDSVGAGFSVLATAEDLPQTPHRVVLSLFLGLQLMYLGFYVGALANLPEIEDLMAALPGWLHTFSVLVGTAAVLIPVRAFVASAALFRAPGARQKLLKMWPFLLIVDELWALSPFLLIHHMDVGVAMACTALLVYAPFAQRSLVLMGAADGPGKQERFGYKAASEPEGRHDR